MILLKQLHLNNFLSHSNSIIDFEDNARVLIDGKSGAGKSSFVEALVWALYNQGRVQSRSLIKRGQNIMSLEFKFKDTDNGDTYFIERKLSIPKKGGQAAHEIKVVKNQKIEPVTGTRAIQDYIEKQILRCSYPLFINSVCLLFAGESGNNKLN